MEAEFLAETKRMQSNGKSRRNSEREDQRPRQFDACSNCHKHVRLSESFRPDPQIYILFLRKYASCVAID